MNRFLPLLAASVLSVSGAAQAAPSATAAVPVNVFLNSIGTQSAISVRGENFPKTIECVRYLGVGWLRAGIEGDVPTAQLLELHRQTGVRFCWGLGSGKSDLARLLRTAEPLARDGALLAFEGPNEPNNWGLTYQGVFGGRDQSWLPVARLQRDLYAAVKSDPLLKDYPVWSTTENGAEEDNVGLQFLTVPPGANTLMPAGTRYADYANCHNYFYHPNSPGVENNKTWNAADPSPACRVDGLYGEYGVTWRHHFAGYSQGELQNLPRVTTETGTTIGGEVTEEIHAFNLLSLYLDQFKRGWSYTANYLMRDRVDESGNQTFGFFRPDYTPRKAALYLHNLTSILADAPLAARSRMPLAQLRYTLAPQPETVHDLLLAKSDGTLALVVWDERVKGSDTAKISFDRRFKSAQLFDPTVGTEAVKTWARVDALSLSLSDHPVVIALRERDQ